MNDLLEAVQRSLMQTLQIGPDRLPADPGFRLLGSIPEFDSMAVLAVVTDLEDKFEFEFDDDEISAELFESLGTLTDFVKVKLANQ